MTRARVSESPLVRVGSEPTGGNETPLLDVRGLTVRFKTRDGVVQAVSDLSFTLRAGRDARRRRRVGLGQERHAASRSWACSTRRTPTSRGEVAVRGQEPARAAADELRKIRGRDIAMIFQDPFACLHPMYRVGDQIAEAVKAHAKVSNSQADARAVELLGAGRDPERARPRPRLPAPVLGRHAPARDDRDGARPQSRRADRRRADDGARRDRAGADPRADRTSEEGVRHRRDPDHARPRGHRRDRARTSWSCTRAAHASTARRTQIFNAAQDPYTWGLLESMPTVDRRLERLVAIEGSPPSLLAPPPGCAVPPSLQVPLRAVRQGAAAARADAGRAPRRLPPARRAEARDLVAARRRRAARVA